MIYAGDFFRRSFIGSVPEIILSKGFKRVNFGVKAGVDYNLAMDVVLDPQVGGSGNFSIGYEFKSGLGLRLAAKPGFTEDYYYLPAGIGLSYRFF